MEALVQSSAGALNMAHISTTFFALEAPLKAPFEFGYLDCFDGLERICSKIV